MRRASLPHCQDGAWWFVSKWSGSLFRSTLPPHDALLGDIPLKVAEALVFCDNPYLCRSPLKFGSLHSKTEHDYRLIWLAKLFALLGNERFFLSTSLAGLDVRLFDTTRLAFDIISRLPGLSWGDDTCLQRSLLAAMTSKTFHQNGVMFVGAELSTGAMHAWIIEDGEQPDLEDRSWINFRPLLALYK